MRLLLGCNVYVSEGRNLQLIRRLQAVCSQSPKAVVLANTFIDEPYNRTGFTLAAVSIPQLVATVQAVTQESLSHIDLSAHQAQHPRLGVLDHVSLHPLGRDASLSLAAQAATAIGQQLAHAPLNLPVYYYGAAHHAQRRLAEIRRNLGYFKPSGNTTIPASSHHSSNTSSTEAWCGSITELQLSAYPPDAGPLTASAAAGVVTVGAVPWVTNFNVPLYTDDMAAARAVARAVSTRGGGLPGVEAMALPHGPGVIEVATNLYNWSRTESQEAARQSRPGLDKAAAHSRESSPAASSAQEASQSPASKAAGSAEDQPMCSRLDGLTGAGPAEVAAAVAAQAQQLGLPAPGPGYVTNKTPPELIAIAAEQLQHE